MTSVSASNTPNFSKTSKTPNTKLYLPSLKSNRKDDPVFYNNTNFISNTKAFYEELKKKLSKNESALEDICQKSLYRINRYKMEQSQKFNDEE